MGLVSLPAAFGSRRLILPHHACLVSRASSSLSQNLHLRASGLGKFPSPFQYKASTSSSPKPRGPSSMSSDDHSSASGEDDQALETVLELHNAINNNNVDGVSDVVDDECCCICNFFPFFKKFHGKKQVVEFFAYLMENLGNNVEIVVQPTQKEGIGVGIAWKLECRRTHVPLGKGFSLYTCHVYQGKVLIRNVEMFGEPLLHLLNPFRVKMVASVTSVLDKIKAKRCAFSWLKLSIIVSLLLSLRYSLLNRLK